MEAESWRDGRLSWPLGYKSLYTATPPDLRPDKISPVDFSLWFFFKLRFRVFAGDGERADAVRTGGSDPVQTRAGASRGDTRNVVEPAAGTSAYLLTRLLT